MICPGLGAGLRQHHFNAGVDRCTNYHDDADPANVYTFDDGAFYVQVDPE